MNKKIGFFGLGIMGSSMAMNLQKGGFDLTVYNRSLEKTKPLTDAGAGIASTVAQLAEQSEIFLTMLSGPPAIEQNALGERGFLNNLKQGSTWIDFSTVNPGFTMKMSVEAEKNNIRFVDAPVAGSKLPAEKGELIILAGGDE